MPGRAVMTRSERMGRRDGDLRPARTFQDLWQPDHHPNHPLAGPGEVLVQPPGLLVGEASRERVLGHDAHAHLVADEPYLAFEARQYLEERATLRLGSAVRPG